MKKINYSDVIFDCLRYDDLQEMCDCLMRRARKEGAKNFYEPVSFLLRIRAENEFLLEEIKAHFENERVDLLNAKIEDVRLFYKDYSDKFEFGYFMMEDYLKVHDAINDARKKIGPKKQRPNTIEPIIWEGNISDLVYLFDNLPALKKRNRNIWEKVEAFFVDENTNPIKRNTIYSLLDKQRMHGAKPHNRKQIDDILKKVKE